MTNKFSGNCREELEVAGILLDYLISFFVNRKSFLEANLRSENKGLRILY